MSRAAKGGDCKSPGYAFVGSSPTSPTTLNRKSVLFIRPLKSTGKLVGSRRGRPLRREARDIFLARTFS
jgi:hypothetical protein